MNLRKSILFYSITIAVFLFSAFSSASSRASLKITGEVLPGACDLGIDNGGALQLGKPHSTPSSDGGKKTLPKRNVNIIIQCPSPTSFGIRAIDIASNAGNVKSHGAATDTVFSLGQTSKGDPIGGYFSTIDKSHSWVDGKPLSNLIVSKDQGHSWQPMLDNLTTNGKNIYSWGDPLQPLSARLVKIGLIISPFIYKYNHSDTVKIDGITSFELVYL
ncbi:DUF1120 domain-containing protein [Pantoea coffeiphila]|nr:DUF1120 domain-containing protein [Pantoea coffeiphila]